MKIFTLIVLLNLFSESGFAKEICHTANYEPQKINCTFKDQKNHTQVVVKIRCGDDAKYIASLNGEPFKAVESTKTAATLEPSSGDSTEFSLGNHQSVWLESHSFIPQITHYFPSSVFIPDTYKDEQLSGHCWAF